MLAQKRILHRATSVLFPRGGTVLSPPAAVRTLSTSCRPWPNATALGPSSTAVASDKKGPTLSTFVSALHAHNTSSSTIADSRRPLFQLDRALLPGLAPSSSSPDTPNAPRPTLTWTINDAGAEECWAIVGPASERGGKVKRALVEAMLGRLRLQKLPSETSDPIAHPALHPFLSSSSSSSSSPSSPRPISEAMQHVSFGTRLASSSGGGGSGGGAFVDYSVRYGAIREEDRVTLYESLMERLGVAVGTVAQARLVPDPLSPSQQGEEGTDVTGLFKYPSRAAASAARAQAEAAHAKVLDTGKLLSLGEELLHRPLVALSNGQTRRARILAALLQGGECVVLEEPYTGLDPPTRDSLTSLLSSLHASRAPRVVLVLREQDSLPSFVTHILRITDEGLITHCGVRAEDSSLAESARASASATTALVQTIRTETREYRKGGYEVVQENARKGIGRGDESQEPVVKMRGVSIAYKGKGVLHDVNLDLHPGSRTILVGDNGSGKTTLLSLLLGDHPQSYAFESSHLSLFGNGRSDFSNATALLARRTGHLSPELFNAFPRKALERGGLSVVDAVGSGFESIFTRRKRTGKQDERVYRLLGLFADLIRTPDGDAIATGLGQDGDGEGGVRALGERAFSELSHGSQALVLLLRAVVHQPRLLVLDEPFQGMDGRQVSRARAFLDEAGSREDGWAVGAEEEEREMDRRKRKEMAMVVVSHYEEEWPAGCGRLVRLSEGRVVERV